MNNDSPFQRDVPIIGQRPNAYIDAVLVILRCGCGRRETIILAGNVVAVCPSCKEQLRLTRSDAVVERTPPPEAIVAGTAH